MGSTRRSRDSPASSSSGASPVTGFTPTPPRSARRSSSRSRFFTLAPYVAYEAVQHIAGGARPETSILGMIVTATSLVGMPFLGIAKQRLADALGSSATHGEGTQNLLCAYLAGAVFLGLAGNTLFGWWWLDPIAAVVIAGVAVKEGLGTWRGEGCCAAPPFVAREPCGDECCD